MQTSKLLRFLCFFNCRLTSPKISQLVSWLIVFLHLLNSPKIHCKSCTAFNVSFGSPPKDTRGCIEIYILFVQPNSISMTSLGTVEKKKMEVTNRVAAPAVKRNSRRAQHGGFGLFMVKWLNSPRMKPQARNALMRVDLTKWTQQMFNLPAWVL